MHAERTNKHKADAPVAEGAVPAYLLEREATARAKVLSNTIKQKRKEKAGKWDVPLPKVRPIAEDEMFKVVRSGKRKTKQWKRLVTKVTFVGPGFTRKPPKYERFIRPMALRFTKAHVTHPELKCTFHLDIISVKKNPNGPMYSSMGVITKGTIIESAAARYGFPPKRALAACQSFRTTRHADSSVRHHEQPANQALMLDRLGDDPLAAASGQVVVGSDRRYRVVYRLVNSIYVLGLMLADDDETSLNVYSCISTVNQACAGGGVQGVDVTPEKIFRKYTEVYMAFFYVLQGTELARLSAVLSYVAGDGRTFELPEEAIAAGDETMEAFAPVASQPCLSKPPPAPPTPSPRPSAALGPPWRRWRCWAPRMTPLPPVTACWEAGGDELALLDAGPGGAGGAVLRAPPSALDPFASDSMADAFGADLEAEGLGGSPRWGTTRGTTPGDGLRGGARCWGGMGTRGGEGGRSRVWGGAGGGGRVWAGRRGDLGAALGGGDGAAGGGQRWRLHGSWSVNPSSQHAASSSNTATPSGPHTAHVPRGGAHQCGLFLGSSLTRVRLSGTVFLAPPNAQGRSAAAGGAMGGGGGAIGGGGGGGSGAGVGGGAEKDGSVADEFSFRLEGSGAIKVRALPALLCRNPCLSSPPPTAFPHMLPLPSTRPSAVPLLRFLSIHPLPHPLPPPSSQRCTMRPGICCSIQRFLVLCLPSLPARFVTRRSDEALSLMIQYVANPYLQAPLMNVTFILSLAFSPASLRLNPEAQLDPWTKELRWHVPQINVCAITHINAPNHSS
ncbi:unnamed protein product [Closterium sp. NIES-65]|nr:unnamed protein product [Closterium sp. NIES-65]